MELRSSQWNLLVTGMRNWRVGAMFLCSTLVLLGGKVVEANDSTHKYDDGEKVVVWVNKVGPWYNPQESYSYYSLPFCQSEEDSAFNKKKPSGLGEILAGNELRKSGLQIAFGVDQETEELCTQEMTESNAEKFTEAVTREYLANLYVDDLPIHVLVGSKPKEGEEDEGPRVNTHQRYMIHYNEDRIIQVHLENEKGVPIRVGESVRFTYEVHWEPTTTPFSQRFDSYLQRNFYEHKIHFLSIFNSFMMVIFLCGFVALLLVRTLKNDFTKYTTDEDDVEGPDAALAEDSGWKQVHGDVFRAPKNLMLFSALHGNGCQIAVLMLGVILFAMAGNLHGNVYEERGEMVSTFIVCYALTSFISGYASGSYYRQFFTTPRAEQSSQWQKTMLLTVMLVPCVLFPMVFALNLVAVRYNTVNTIPFLTVLQIMLVWLFISFPLCVAGSMFGRHWGGRGNFPCRVNSIPRQIPEGAWYAQPAVVIPCAGILPFGSIVIEMYYILTSLWGYFSYYVYHFMLVVFVILAVVLVCTTIVAVYVVLNAENYHWQWVSFLSAGSTAGYVFLYALYFFEIRTQQSGFMQVSFYFGYMGLLCAALFVMCGSIGVMGSTVFVRQIYRNIKVD